MILGSPQAPQSVENDELEALESCARRAVQELLPLVAVNDVLIVYGVGAAAIGHQLRKQRRVHMLWRTLLGRDDRLPSTRAAWRVLRDSLITYDRGLFVSPAYTPQFFTHRSALMTPGIDPLHTRNRELSLHEVVDTLCAAGMVPDHQPVLRERFSYPAQRLGADGHMHAVNDIGLLFKPVLSNISTWDPHKGQVSLLEAFVKLKQNAVQHTTQQESASAQRRLQQAQLLICGPDPESLENDNERHLFEALRSRYQSLPSALQNDISIIALATNDLGENALLVNALQRISTLFVQNSLCEGWGLGVTEAAYKGVAVLGSLASGTRLQVRHEIDGLLCEAPQEPDELAQNMAQLLIDPQTRNRYAKSAQRRVRAEFMVTHELQRCLRLLNDFF